MKLRKKQLTPAEIIQAEQNKVSESFGMFTKLRNDIKESITKIQGAKIESGKRIESLKAQMKNEENTQELAEAEINANMGLLSKIEEFIPSKEVAK
jgi:hypothetical protein